MEANHKKILKAISLELRHLLEGYYDSNGRWQPGDLEQRLAAIGVRRDREPVPVDELAHLSDDDKNGRTVVDAYLQLRDEADVSREEAVAEFVRETAYTWANRLLCLRCMEARELIDEVILQKEAYGGRSLEHHRLAQREPEVCSGEDDGLFAVLKKVFTDQTEHLPLLFDPQSPGVALKPSPAVLKRCLALLSGIEAVRSQDPATGEVFQAPDALGWAYQYWNTEEKDRVFEKVRTKKGAKIAGADIIPATQLYTEPYMVKFLVQNSLGATWMGMYPDSKLHEKWEYYVRDADRAPVEKKPVAEITFFDPACGSGHFLIEAFDLYYDMYEEEGELTEAEDICGSILEKNLFGIDIDARAVQIAEAALWMKAAERAFDFQGAATNLVAAVASHLKGDLWEEFLTGFEREPSVARVLRKFGQAMDHIDELGSLARPDEELLAIIHEEHATWERQVREQKEANFLFPEMVEDALSGQLPFHEVSDEEFGERLLYRAKAAIDGFTMRASEEGAFQDQFIAHETTEGFRLLDLLSKHYDVVAANPPYMGSKNMGSTSKRHIEVCYCPGKRDLYSAFILRCLQLAGDGGYTAVVTQDSWMFLRSYEQLRTELLSNYTLRVLAHLGTSAFDSPLLTSVVCTVIGNHACDVSGRCTIIRATDQPDPIHKENVLREAATNADLSAAIRRSQHTFIRISGCPLTYAIPEPLLAVLGSPDEETSLASVANARSGMVTGENNRFVRFVWESPFCQWRIPYAKGQGILSFCDASNTVIDWRDCSQDQYRTGTNRSVVLSRQAPLYVNVPCLTYSSVAARKFSTRLFRGGAFDYGGSCLFFSDIPLDAASAVMNSTVYRLLLKALNPTLNFQPVDFQRLPWPKLTADQLECLEELGHFCRRCKEVLLTDCVTQHDYERPHHFAGNSLHEMLRHEMSNILVADAFFVSCVIKIDELVCSTFQVTPESVYAETGMRGTGSIACKCTEPGTETDDTSWRQNEPAFLEHIADVIHVSPDAVRSAIGNEYREQDRRSNDEIAQRLLCTFAAGFDTTMALAAMNGQLGDSVEAGEEDSEMSALQKREPPETVIEAITFTWGVHPFDVCRQLEQLLVDSKLPCSSFNERVVAEHFTVIILQLLGHRWPKQIEAGEPVPEWTDLDGVIPLTEGTDESTLLERVRERIAAEFEDGDVAAIEREFAEIMGKPLEKWLTMEFFKHHTRQFKKRPIAWQIQSSKFTARKQPAFACLIYYHRLDGDLLPKIRNQYVGPLRSRLETELRSIESVSTDARSDRQEGRRGELQDQIDELRDFDAALQKVITGGFASKELTKIVKDEPLDKWCSLDGTRPEPESQEALLQQESRYFPDINDGVRVNIAPLQKAGLLAADVLAKKDLDKAIADRAQWRADERRWCRENKLPQPGWWPEQGAGAGGQGPEEGA